MTADERKAKLETALDRVITELAEGDIKPTYSINGQSVQWVQYRQFLSEEAERLRGLVDAFDDEDGIAFEITEGRTC